LFEKGKKHLKIAKTTTFKNHQILKRAIDYKHNISNHQLMLKQPKKHQLQN